MKKSFHQRALNLSNDDGGAAMIVAMGAIVILAVLGLNLIQGTTNEYHSIVKDSGSSKSSNFAEAGIEKALKEININPSYTGTSLTNIADGQYEVSVSGGSTQKVVIATGYYPSKAATTSQRTIRAILELTDAMNGSFDFAIHAGTGGVLITDEFGIDGSVYSNADIQGDEHDRVTIQHDAYAVGQIRQVTVRGTKRTGQPEEPLPTFNMDYWRAAAEAGGTQSGFTMSSGSRTLGPKKIIGDMVITGGDLTITGPIWVTGDIRVGNCDIYLDESFGDMGTLIFTDGIFRSYNNVVYHRAIRPRRGSESGGYILMVSNYSGPDYGVFVYGGFYIAAYCKDGGIYIDDRDVGGVLFTLVGKKVVIPSYKGSFLYSSDLSSAEFGGGGSGYGWGVKEGSWREGS